MTEPTRPRIGITARLSRLGCGSTDPAMQEAEKAFDSVVALILESDAEPVIIGPGTDEELMERFACCHGFVLPGGGDVNPVLFGGADDDPTLFGVDPEQDRIDMAAIRFGLDNGLPVLGICRGMQLLNVARGGSLHTDLRPSSVSHYELRHNNTMDFAVHEAELEAESRVSAVFVGAARIKVASFHHQAINVLGDGLRVTAHADDGLAEAIELTGENWVLGIQWHPEANLPEAELGQPLFTALKKEAELTLLPLTTPNFECQEA